MTQEERFERWKMSVDLYLLQMIKKQTEDLKTYDLFKDFQDGLTVDETATKIIQRDFIF